MRIIFIIMISILLAVAVSCAGKLKHQISGINGSNAAINVGPNFKEAAAFCDERYVALSKESEKCFADYRNFYTLKLSIDMDSIIDYCDRFHETDRVTNTDECIDNLTELFTIMSKQD